MIEPMPPKMTSTTTVIETCSAKFDGKTGPSFADERTPATPDVRRANGEGHDLVLQTVDTERAGGDFVLADGRPRSSDLRMVQGVEEEQDRYYEREEQIIEIEVISSRRTRRGQK